MDTANAMRRSVGRRDNLVVLLLNSGSPYHLSKKYLFIYIVVLIAFDMSAKSPLSNLLHPLTRSMDNHPIVQLDNNFAPRLRENKRKTGMDRRGYRRYPEHSGEEHGGAKVLPIGLTYRLGVLCE